MLGPESAGGGAVPAPRPPPCAHAGAASSYALPPTARRRRARRGRTCPLPWPLRARPRTPPKNATLARVTAAFLTPDNPPRVCKQVSVLPFPFPDEPTAGRASPGAPQPQLNQAPTSAVRGLQDDEGRGAAGGPRPPGGSVCCGAGAARGRALACSRQSRGVRSLGGARGGPRGGRPRAGSWARRPQRSPTKSHGPPPGAARAARKRGPAAAPGGGRAWKAAASGISKRHPARRRAGAAAAGPPAGHPVCRLSLACARGPAHGTRRPRGARALGGWVGVWGVSVSEPKGGRGVYAGRGPAGCALWGWGVSGYGVAGAQGILAPLGPPKSRGASSHGRACVSVSQGSEGEGGSCRPRWRAGAPWRAGAGGGARGGVPRARRDRRPESGPRSRPALPGRAGRLTPTGAAAASAAASRARCRCRARPGGP
jgi:hypothetical protein